MTEQYESSQEYEAMADKSSSLESVILNQGLIGELNTLLNLDENQQQTLWDLYVSEEKKQNAKFAIFDNQPIELTGKEIHWMARGNLRTEETLWELKFERQELKKQWEEKEKWKQDHPFLNKLTEVFKFR